MVRAIKSLLLPFGLSLACALSPCASASAQSGVRSLTVSTNLQTTERLYTPAKRIPAKRDAPRARKRQSLRAPDVIYYPTPPETVTEMLRLAKIKDGDVLYDLGSGDGRIPIMAAQQYGIRTVGIDIDPKMIAIAEEGARQAGVADRVRFRHADLFRAEIKEATVVTLYLSKRLNLLLRPKLLRELRPGTRILSHDFAMGDWKPEQTIKVPWRNLYRTIYLWTVPPRKRK